MATLGEVSEYRLAARKRARKYAARATYQVDAQQTTAAPLQAALMSRAAACASLAVYWQREAEVGSPPPPLPSG